LKIFLSNYPYFVQYQAFIGKHLLWWSSNSLAFHFKFTAWNNSILFYFGSQILIQKADPMICKSLQEKNFMKIISWIDFSERSQILIDSCSILLQTCLMKDFDFSYFSIPHLCTIYEGYSNIDSVINYINLIGNLFVKLLKLFHIQKMILFLSFKILWNFSNQRFCLLKFTGPKQSFNWFIGLSKYLIRGKSSKKTIFKFFLLVWIYEIKIIFKIDLLQFFGLLMLQIKKAGLIIVLSNFKKVNLVILLIFFQKNYLILLSSKSVQFEI
jgi:hypothetical protein